MFPVSSLPSQPAPAPAGTQPPARVHTRRLAPLLISLAVHAVLAAALTLLALPVVLPSPAPPPPSPPTSRVLLTLKPPSPASTTPASPAPQAPPPSPPVTQPPPSPPPTPLPPPPAAANPGSALTIRTVELPPAPAPLPGRPAASAPPAPAGQPGELSRPAPSAPAGSPAVSFAGLVADGSPAQSIVYVVDASGPMVASLPLVLAELRRSVRTLAPGQRFNVVLFSQREGSAGVDAFATDLRSPTPDTLSDLDRFLGEARPGGRSNPMAGLRTALAQRPHVVFLLTRAIARSGGAAWDVGLDPLLAELDRLNPVDPASGRRGSIIKTIQFLEPDPTGVLQAIARAHGSGVIAEDHRVLSEADLQAGR